MSRWPLKLKVGVYCAVLTVFALFGAAAVILPFVFHREVAAVDKDLADDLREMVEEMEKTLGPAAQWRRPLASRDVPQAFRRRYITIEIKDGPELFRTGHVNLKEVNLRDLALGTDTMEILDRNDEPFVMKRCRFVSVPYGRTIVRMGTRLTNVELVQADLRAAFYYVLPVFGIIVFAGAILLARRALRPVTAMTAAAERISAESPDERLPSPIANDEIARLTTVLNASFGRLQRAYSSAARFSADASHQLKTPIAVLRAGLDELRVSENLNDDDREVVDALVQQTRRLTSLVEDLLLLAQADAGRLRVEPTPFDLVPVLDAVLDDVEALSEENAIAVERDLPEHLFAKADVRRVKIILQNLGENAVKYNRAGGTIRFAARSDGQWVSISVANTGAEIPQQYHERLFERFNRAGMGEDIKGHGLGLNISRELARAHGGDLTLTRSSAWTEFTLRLPSSGIPLQAPTLAASSAAP
jgi:signal transduction histidine kinase